MPHAPPVSYILRFVNGILRQFSTRRDLSKLKYTREIHVLESYVSAVTPFHLLGQCIDLSRFLASSREATVKAVPKFRKGHRFLHTLSENVILKMVRMHNEERTFLNANQCDLRARHGMTLSVWEACGPPDLEFLYDRDMAVFMDSKIAYDTIISKITIFG
jgi:hypothetical protein